MDFQTPFRFKCHPGVNCFTNCCGDVTIFLTPYDVLAFKKPPWSVSSAEFMEKHTLLLTREKQGHSPGGPQDVGQREKDLSFCH